MMLNGLLLSSVLSLALLAGFGAPAVAQTTITISCSSLGIELQLCQTGADAWGKQTDNQVKLVTTPADGTERLSLYQTLLAAHSSDVDVFQIAADWPGTLAGHFIDMKQYISADDLKDHIPTIVENNTVGGKLVAVPWFSDAGLLYYRNDLLGKYHKDVPKTWSELADTAKAVVDGEKQAGNSALQGYVWQGRLYEGLTCNAIEWVASYGGGSIIDQGGKVTINNPQAARAINEAKSWVGSISPAGVLTYAEEESRGVFQSGKAVFMRNWPYAWALANSADSPVKDKVGIAVLPAGEGSAARPAAALGGQELGISAYSKHPKEAADLVRYLTSAVEEKRRAIQGAFAPTRQSVYSDPEVLSANPFFASFGDVLKNAVARPSTITGAKYNHVSSEFQRAVHNTLSGQGTAEENLANAERALQRLSRGGHW
jgi:trehalose/maltose transport system substrate-binding protein